MSAAAVIIVRIKRVFAFLRERRAVSPESAIHESEVPYSDRWYYGRLVDYGAVKRVGDRCYLDENVAQAYLRDWRRRGLRFAALAALAFAVLWLIWALIN
jgi:hypothetical protein